LKPAQRVLTIAGLTGISIPCFYKYSSISTNSKFPVMNMIKSLKLLHLLVLPVIVTVLLSACRESASRSNNEEDKHLIEQAINNAIGWAGTKDLNLLYSVIANDTSFLEVHPEGKVVRGINDFRKSEAFWMSPDFKAVRYEIKDLSINISKSGTVAWWFCILDDINEWKGEPASWENTRWTGVLEKRDGRWQIVQQHFSFACK
jgi:ketosteroid isomerase-like protein